MQKLSLAEKWFRSSKRKKLPSGNTGGETVVSETIGGVLHWGQETSPDLEWFRKKILEANGGRAPVVLDPFAGGGAIPLEAMRLGCEVQPRWILIRVAWLGILKFCTLLRNILTAIGRASAAAAAVRTRCARFHGAVLQGHEQADKKAA